MARLWQITLGQAPPLLLLCLLLGFLCLFQGLFWFFADAEGRYKRRLKNRLQNLGATGDSPLANSLLRAHDSSFVNLKKFPSLGQIQELLSQADVHWRLGTFVCLILLSGVVGLCLGLLKWGPLGGLVGGGLGLALPYKTLVLKKKRRLRKFEKQLPDALDLLARGIKAGHAFTSGLQLVAEEMPYPLGLEFSKTFKEHSHGLELNAALANLCRRVDLRDLRFFTTAVVIQRETGGNLVEILEKISGLIRERFKLRNQVQALTAEGRLSGLILVALPPLLFTFLAFLNPDYQLMLIRHPRGRMMAMVALGFQAVGMLAIRKIVNIKV